MSARAFRTKATENTTFYAPVFGTRGAVASHHYLSADAGVAILKSGGNAIDSAVAAALVEGVVNPQMHTVGGECPMLIRTAADSRVYVINGNTVSPERATPDAFRNRGLTSVPEEGVLAAGVPAALGAYVTALMHFGSLPFNAVSEPARELLKQGFPVHRGLVNQERFGIRDLADKFRREWLGSAALYLPHDRLPQEGDVIRNPQLAAVFEHLCDLERTAGFDRIEGLQAVFDGFYRGDVASELIKHTQAHDGLLARNDLARFETKVESPVELSFGESVLFKCGFWNQGPVVLQTLAILAHWDLAALGHNSAEYLHLLIEATKLAYADRDQYYGDPLRVDVPAENLLSKQYARLRSELIDLSHASPELRSGDPRGLEALLAYQQRLGGAVWGPGTVHVDAIDRDGNMVAATASGGWIKSSEVIPALGFPLGNRLMTFYLEPSHHPNVVAPFKQPRTTISPSLALRRGMPWMVFGSMGGDQQDQWQLQFFLNRLVFGMGVQEAIEAPKFSSEHFPGFFAPHDRFPNRVRIEPRVGDAVVRELNRRGHSVEVAADWSEGYLLCAARRTDGVLEAGCDPRGAKGEIFPACARAL